MNILILHNRYQERGGEDLVVEQETTMLRNKGHRVDVLLFDNRSVDSFQQRVVVACRTIYSRGSRTQVAKAITKNRPDIVHVHNFFPQWSPSVYSACHDAQVPVVQTLHNFRLVCPNALLFREGQPCERCLGRFVAYPGIINGCYRESRVGTAVVAAMITSHRIAGTWRRGVDAYIALSRFAKSKLAVGGIPEEKLFVKPNCLSADPGAGKHQGGFALFVGRLAPEKGVETLLTAWSKLHHAKLVIVGEGPLRPLVEETALRIGNIEYLAGQSNERVLDLLGDSAFAVFPSECYENFPRVILEALAKGTPVLGSRLGAAEELIDDGRTGMLFRAGDANDLATKAHHLFAASGVLGAMSVAARHEFESKYTGDRNYDQLMAIYQAAAGRPTATAASRRVSAASISS